MVTFLFFFSTIGPAVTFKREETTGGQWLILVYDRPLFSCDFFNGG